MAESTRATPASTRVTQLVTGLAFGDEWVSTAPLGLLWRSDSPVG
jgi:hypothetical protein